MRMLVDPLLVAALAAWLVWRLQHEAAVNDSWNRTTTVYVTITADVSGVAEALRRAAWTTEEASAAMRRFGKEAVRAATVMYDEVTVWTDAERDRVWDRFGPTQSDPEETP